VARLGTQESPEVPLAVSAVGDLRRAVSDLAAEMRVVGDACEEYAAGVEEHRAIIRGIIADMAVEAGLSIVAGTVVGFFTFGGGAAAGGAVAGWRIAVAAQKILTALRALHDLARLRAAARLTAVVERIGPLRSVLLRLKRAERMRIGQTTAGHPTDDLGKVLGRADLSPAQLANLSRHVKRMPAGLQTVITRGADGTIHLITKVPGRVPGSFAEYDKVVDVTGKTIDVIKTTYAPNGSIVHIKHKLAP